MNAQQKLIFLSLFSIVFFSQKTNAQITVGGGLAYGTEIETVGFNATGQYFIKENIAIVPSFTYYLPRNIVGNFSLKWFEINADINYYFDLENSNIKPYGLGGLNYSIITVPSFDFGILGSSDSSSNSELGFNLGAGADYDLGKKITPFAQLKYTLGDADQLTILAGIRYEL